MNDLERAISDAVDTGWIRRETIDGEDYIVLTEYGAEWLKRDLEARERTERMKTALAKISTAARRDTSLSPPDPLLEFIVAQVDSAE